MAAIAYAQPDWDRFDEQVTRRAPVRVRTPPPSRQRPELVVYRRRQFVAVALLVVLVVVTAFVAVQAGRIVTASASAGAAPASRAVVVAQPGDSYWSLATRLHEGGDLRSTVDALVAANGGRGLQPGDRIELDR